MSNTLKTNFFARAPGYTSIDNLQREIHNGSWALKSSNLRLVVHSVEAFYLNEFGMDEMCQSIDITAIAKEDDDREIANLIQLILGCALGIKTDNNSFIRAIMEMDQRHQEAFQRIISENVVHRPPSPEKKHAKQSFDRFSEQECGNEGVPQPCQPQIEELQLQIQTLEQQQERLKLELAKSHEKHQSFVEREAKALVKQRENQGEATLRQHSAETQLHDLQVQLDEKDQALARQQQKHMDQISHFESENRAQAEELDISRSKVRQCDSLLSKVKKYEMKLEEAIHAKRQLKEFEAQNNNYLEKIVELESAGKSIPTLRATVEKYKEQVVDLETRNVELVSTNEIHQSSINQLNEELESALGGKEFLEEQLESVRAELEHVQRENGDTITGQQSSSFASSLAATLEQDKLERELAETSNLRSSVGDSSLEMNMLNSQLDDMKRIQKKLQESNLSLKQDNHALMNEIKGLKSRCESNSNSAEKKFADMESIIQRKDSEIAHMDQRRSKLESYLKKTLHAVQAKCASQNRDHRDALNEREAKIQYLNEQLRETRKGHKREEALMMSAFYDVGEEMQRRALMQPSSLPSQNQGNEPTSWLARQRKNNTPTRR